MAVQGSKTAKPAIGSNAEQWDVIVVGAGNAAFAAADARQLDSATPSGTGSGR